MPVLPLPVYVINLPQREDRRLHTIIQFSDKKDFSLKFINPILDKKKEKSLWRTIQGIIRNADESECVTICEDDNQFTKDYSMEILLNCIIEAKSLNADILMGGISWCNNAFPVRSSLFWVDKFSGLQFTVIFRQFFPKILQASFNDYDCADYKISDLTDKKFVIFPFISIQRDFGYSDITPKNNGEGRVTKLFEDSSACLSALSKVENFYKGAAAPPSIKEPDYNEITIPTYIINLPDRTDRLEHIKQEFAGRNEFDPTVVEACRHAIGAVGLWQSIRKVVSLAIDNDDDVIIICEDDHMFTEHYSRSAFLRNVLEAHSQGIDMFVGGVAGANHILPISENRFWVSSFWSTQFIILYKNSFDLIINEAYNDEVTADGKLSEIIVNKTVLFPFISVQKEFGYSDISVYYNEQRENNPPHKKFQDSFCKFEHIRKIYKKYRGS